MNWLQKVIKFMPTGKKEHSTEIVADINDNNVDIQKNTPKEQTKNILKKLSDLKSSLKLDDNLSEKIESIHSFQEFLLFVHETFILRYNIIAKIGFLDEKSAATLKSIDHRLLKTISDLNQAQNLETRDPKEIIAENQSLRRQLQVLYDKHVKNDIISERELELEAENTKLKARKNDLDMRLKVSQEKLAENKISQEKVKKVVRRNRSLSSRLSYLERQSKAFEPLRERSSQLELQFAMLREKYEHQTKLVKSLLTKAGDDSDVVNRMEQVQEEKLKLKAELASDAALIERELDLLKQQDTEMGSLAQEYEKLVDKVEERDLLLQSSQENSQEDLVDGLDQMEQDKGFLNQKREFQNSFRQVQNKGEVAAKQLLDLLKQENIRLKGELEIKTRQLKLMSISPESKKLHEKLILLDKENKRLGRELNYKNSLYQEASDKQEELLQKTAHLEETERENRKLIMDMEKKDKLILSLKSMEVEYKQIKSELTKVYKRYKDIFENYNKQKVGYEKLKKEHEAILEEYRTLFNT